MISFLKLDVDTEGGGHKQIIAPRKVMMLKLKLQYFGHLMRRADSFEKTLMLERLRAGGEGDNRG